MYFTREIVINKETCQVFGVPDFRLGEDVAAWLRVEDGAQLSPDQFKTWCQDKVSILPSRLRD